MQRFQNIAVGRQITATKQAQKRHEEPQLAKINPSPKPVARFAKFQD
jgi:hypothetical protein